MPSCSKPKTLEVPIYTISREGGILGKSVFADITVDEELREEVFSLKGNFLDEQVLSEITSIKEDYPDSFTYRVKITINGSVKKEYVISEGSLSDDQLDFIDMVYEIAKSKN